MGVHVTRREPRRTRDAINHEEAWKNTRRPKTRRAPLYFWKNGEPPLRGFLLIFCATSLLCAARLERRCVDGFCGAVTVRSRSGLPQRVGALQVLDEL